MAHPNSMYNDPAAPVAPRKGGKTLFMALGALGLIGGVALAMRALPKGGAVDDEGDDSDEVQIIPVKPAKTKTPRQKANDGKNELMREMGKKGAQKRWAKKKADEEIPPAPPVDGAENDGSNVPA